MANGVIPPPGGASPLPQVTDAQEWGRDPKEEKGGLWLTWGFPDPGTELSWGIWRKRGSFAIFSGLLPPLLPSPGSLAAWGEGAEEDGGFWSLPHPPPPGLGVGVGVWVFMGQGPLG